MGMADKLRHDEQAAGRAITIRRMVWLAVGAAFLLFILFYLLLPIWRQ